MFRFLTSMEVVILDKSNTIMAVLGHNADPKKRSNYNIPQEQWIEGSSAVPTVRIGQRGKPVRSGLERIRKNHEAGTVKEMALAK